ncbi:MAG: hypothetical protein ACI9H8_001585 [Lysobacterales bacterium]|jgi:hypothetical protein
MKNISLTVLASFLGMQILASCVHTSSGPILPTRTEVSFEVEFLVAGSSVKMFTGGQGCAKNDKGCVRVPAGDSALVTFKFQNNQNYPCGSNPNSHYISEIAFANLPKTFGVPVAKWIQDDFGAAPDTGVVWKHTSGTPVQSVDITDKNENPGVAYYQISVEACNDPGVPIITDPRMENEG